ncbi:MAG: DUF4974 domain-containing protein [Tannerella sp.]|nr:DUF4974 domain-containing protein [Tannerella sp.]
MENNTQHIIAYLENRLSPEEREAFETLLDNSAGLRREMAEIRFVRDISAELMEHRRIDTAKNWDELSRRVAADRYRRKLWAVLRNTAAALVIPLIMATIVLYGKVNERGRVADAGQVELTSASGLVTKITLPDESEVWLNSGSRLSYPQRFTGNIRSVHLSGEAYFKVKADKTNIFEVRTKDGLRVCAYGTEFNVCAYDDEPVIEATLVSGNVEVSAPVNGASGSVNVREGQQVLFDRESGSLVTVGANLAVKTSWKDGKMIFRRANMTEIARRFARHFNVDIRLEGEELYGYEYSASFTAETLDEILHLLEKSAPIKCKIIYPEQSEDYAFTKKTVIISMKQKEGGSR